MMEFSFEKLIIWQKSRSIVKDVYKIASKFPPHEKYALSDQLRRAAVSVSSNIAEGTGRFSNKEKIHFCEIAYGSLMEVICQLTLAVDLGLAAEEDVNKLRPTFEELSRQLCAYRKSMFKEEHLSKP